jgi:hypothetical protein
MRKRGSTMPVGDRRAPRRNWQLIDLVKKEARTQLDEGKRDVVLDVRGMTMRERNIVRSALHRWGDQNDRKVRVHFDPDAWTLTVTVTDRVEETSE